MNSALLSTTVILPATTANLGPGFDSFGIALNIFNRVTLQKNSAPIDLPLMFEGAAVSFFKTTDQKQLGLYQITQ
jgi:homoserine kinase